MKKKLFYISPKCETFVLETEDFVCISGDGDGHTNDYPGFFWF